MASCTHTPSAPGLTPDKQPQHTPEARLAHTQISEPGTHNWNPWWAHTLISSPAARTHRPKARYQCAPNQQTSCLSAQTQSAWVGSYPNQCPGAHTWNPEWAPTPETLGGCAPWSAAWLPGCTDQKLGIYVQPDQWPGCPRATTHEAPVLKNSHLVPVHRALQGLLTL